MVSKIRIINFMIQPRKNMNNLRLKKKKSLKDRETKSKTHISHLLFQLTKRPHQLGLGENESRTLELNSASNMGVRIKPLSLQWFPPRHVLTGVLKAEAEPELEPRYSNLRCRHLNFCTKCSFQVSWVLCNTLTVDFN